MPDDDDEVVDDAVLEAMRAVSEALTNDDYETALPHVERALELAPDLDVALQARTLALMELERDEEALAACDAALVKAPDDPSLLGSRVHILRRLGRFEEAADAARRLVEVQPTADSWYLLALILFFADEVKEAENAALTSVEADESIAASWTVLTMARLSLGRAEEALEPALRARQIEPENGENWFREGLVLSTLERWPDALVAFQHATRLIPDSADAWARQAAALSELGSGDAALAAADRAVTLDTDDADVWQIRGIVLSELERLDDALASWERAAELDPDDDTAWFNVSVGLANLQRYEEALVAVERGLTIGDEKDPRGLVQRARLLGALEQYVDALEAFDAALAQVPGDLEAQLGKGTAQQRLGLSEEAVVTFRGALQQSPRVGQLWFALADVYATLGREDSAVRAYRRSWDCGPAVPSTAVALAVHLMQLDRNAEAVEFLEEVSATGIEASIIDFNRGLALYRVQREREAVRAWRAAADGEPPIPQARELLAALEVEEGHGAWFDYWFGDATGWPRRLLGAALFVTFVGVIALPVLKPGSLPGFISGHDWQRVLIPAIGLALLLLLPALSKITAGPVGLEASPVGAGPPRKFSPVDVPPALTVDEIDIRVLQRG